MPKNKGLRGRQGFNRSRAPHLVCVHTITTMRVHVKTIYNALKLSMPSPMCYTELSPVSTTIIVVSHSASWCTAACVGKDNNKVVLQFQIYHLLHCSL